MDKPTENPDIWFVIANPEAGAGRVRRRWEDLSLQLKRHLPGAPVAFSESRGHATELAAQAINRGYRRLLAIGGDGTCHEVANAILQQKKIPPQALTLALLPVGRGNDWIRTYNIPRDTEKWFAMLREGQTVLQDAGLLEYRDMQGRPCRRYFINVAGIAFAAHVVYRLERQLAPAWMRKSYLLLLLQSLIRYNSPAARLSFDEKNMDGRFVTIEAGIGQYIGGGLHLLPHALPADGRLALTIAHHTSKLDILFNIWRFFDGSIGRHRKIALYQASHFHAEPLDSSPLLVEADGEFLGQAPVTIDLIPQAIRIVVPKGQAKIKQEKGFETKTDSLGK